MGSRPLTLRLKAKDGQHVLNRLTLESTLEELKNTISELTHIPPEALRLLRGFPPRPMDAAGNTEQLGALDIRSGETLIVEEDKAARAALEERQSEALLRTLEAQMTSAEGILVRQVVPADNSCLFTSIHFSLEGGRLDTGCAPAMRQIIASRVLADPDTYNQALLGGRSNADYCAWILDDNSWGGAIELAVLSQHYGVEIDVVDTQSVRVNRFGEDRHYPRRVLLIYDGIHYDPLLLEPLDPAAPKQTVFSTDSDDILTQALDLAAEAKSSRQFTDTHQFSLRCLICNKCLVGQAEAQDHAQRTGHINFGEV